MPAFFGTYCTPFPRTRPNPSNGDGVLDFSELSSGLSVLCGGSHDEKAAAAFSLFDYNGDGFISLEEMEQYLTSVFKVVYLCTPGTQDAMGGVDAAELAAATARGAFEEADLNHDGRLSFDEFQRWYEKTPGGQQVQAVVDSAPPWVSMEEVKRLTRLEHYRADAVFEELAVQADDEGLLSKNAFIAAFKKFVSAHGGIGDEDKKRLSIVLSNLFAVFDTDNNGAVDFTELASGLSVLCGGDHNQKAESAFALYDYNGDGFISLDEMTAYLASVFKIVYLVQPNTQEAMGGIAAEELAAVTAEHCFSAADLDGDGRLSFDEFRQWYNQDSASRDFVVAMENEAPEWVTLQEIRRLTRLSALTADECFERFAAAADDEGLISKADFTAVFNQIAAPGGETGEHVYSEAWLEQERATIIINQIFDLFDSNSDGVVDFCELASGLSVLCGGTRDNKAASAFSLYDFNNDGFISLEEMEQYLNSVFKVLYAAQPGTQESMGGISAAELAGLTAEHAFAAADLDGDGRLSFDEFQRWYNSDGGQQVQSVADSVPSWVSLKEIRRLTHLEQHNAEDVFEEFAVAADEEGLLDRHAFEETFRGIIMRSAGSGNLGQEDRDRIEFVVESIFDLFDADGNGTIDFAELASGISVLCGGNRDDKAAAAFALYDINGDGYISLEEMTQYLRNVFMVLYAANPSTAEAMGGVGAAELAGVTAEQCFLEADLNHDGRLSFDEFKRWYSEGAALGGDAATDESEGADDGWVSLESIRKLSRLELFAAEDVFEEFAVAADEDGLLSRAAFLDVFQNVVAAGIEASGETLGKAELQRTEAVIETLFDLFDENGDGTVDFLDLASGLSVLCGGNRDDKAASAFSLYDYNGDGFISLDEFTRYLKCVYRVIYAVEGETVRATMGGISEDELATATAERCFAEADLNHDGRLSFSEFQRWYSKPFAAALGGTGANGGGGGGGGGGGDGGGGGGGGGGRGGERVPTEVQASSVPSTLNDVRTFLGFRDKRPEDMFDVFAVRADEDGYLSREHFNDSVLECMGDLAPSEGDEAQQVVLSVVLDRLFSAFDQDGNNVVDFSELASGLSVLCGGSRASKVRASFELYDYNCDGFITLDEMTRHVSARGSINFRALKCRFCSDFTVVPGLAHGCVCPLYVVRQVLN